VPEGQPALSLVEFRPQSGRSATDEYLITSVERESPQDAPGRAKPHGSGGSPRPRWRPKTWNGKRVDPA
jgi:hypothetical protein